MLATLSKFQYITCYSLSFCRVSAPRIFSVSIHHMLLFILRRSDRARLHLDVSIHHMLLFIRTWQQTKALQRCFNTSHVTLYPKANQKAEDECMFQYITCYSLSAIEKFEKGIRFRFQYITCYSLSILKSLIQNFKRVSIHHMLLFIVALKEL